MPQSVSSATLWQIKKIQKTSAPELVRAVKSGVISINATAAVATLPSEEPVATVTGGKKELPQTARRVREARLSSKLEVSPQTNEATTEQIELHRLM